MSAKSLRLLAGLALAVFFTAPIGAGETAGSWTIRPADTPDKVQLTFVHDRAVQAADWRPADLMGLQLASDQQRHDVRFFIERDAGRIEAQGVSSSGTAAGSFRFQADPDYAGEMRKLGIGEIKPDALLSLALHDVSLAYLRDMAALGLGAPTVGKLLAWRIHGVDPAYVKDLRAAGVRPNADELIAFRIHGVTPDFVAALRTLGYDTPAPGQLIAMRIHGVTPDYIASVKARGVRDTSLDQLVAMKIQGID